MARKKTKKKKRFERQTETDRFCVDVSSKYLCFVLENNAVSDKEKVYRVRKGEEREKDRRKSYPLRRGGKARFCQVACK